MKNELVVSWQGDVIGVMERPSVDNFFVYGPWQRRCAPELYAAFLRELDETGDLVVEVQSNGHTTSARLLIEPDEEIELRMDPSLLAKPGAPGSKAR